MHNVAFSQFSSTKVRQNNKKARPQVTQKGIIVPLNRDVIQFSGHDRLTRFSRLHELDKREIQDALEYIYNEEKQWMHTMLGKKPSALVTLPPKHSNVLLAYKDIVLPENFALVKVKRSLPRGQRLKNDSLYIVNIPATTKVVEKHLQYFRQRLNDGNLTPQDVMQKLTGKDSPLKDMDNYGDLAGIVLGFPFGDSLVFRLYYEAKLMCEAMQDHADQKQKQIMSTITQVLRQDVQFSENPVNHEIEPTSRNSELPITPLGIPVAKLHPGIKSLYKYYTWEGDSQRNRDFAQKLDHDVQTTNRFFDSPEKFTHFMLATDLYK